MGNDAIKPRTRLAKFLAKIAGLYEGDITPRTDVEKYLDRIAENGGGGGGNVLTLYGRMEEGALVVYIDPEYTKERFDTYQEAADAVMGADSIKLVYDAEGKEGTVHHCYFATDGHCLENSDVNVVVGSTFYHLWLAEETPGSGGGNMA